MYSVSVAVCYLTALGASIRSIAIPASTISRPWACRFNNAYVRQIKAGKKLPASFALPPPNLPMLGKMRKHLVRKYDTLT
jgi:hypothetical protein